MVLSVLFQKVNIPLISFKYSRDAEGQASENPASEAPQA